MILVACAHHLGAVPVPRPPPRMHSKFQPVLNNVVSLCSLVPFKKSLELCLCPYPPFVSFQEAV